MAKDYPYKSSSTWATEEDPDICIQDDLLWGVISIYYIQFIIGTKLYCLSKALP